MTDALTILDGGLAANRHVRILKRGGGRIAVSPLERQPEPVGLVALKAEIARRWPMTGLLDMLKEADLRVGFTDALRGVVQSPAFLGYAGHAKTYPPGQGRLGVSRLSP